ncbi:DUF924 family protein [Myxosarcina sp. GI1(2024)]
MEYQKVLDFWFSKPEDLNYGKALKFWFVKNDELDLKIKSQFQHLYERAAAGELHYWQQQPLSCLALIIVLDQFPRNMFRGSPRAFATDERAKSHAQYAITHQFDLQLIPVQRWFIYLPFEHSENLEDQETSLKLFNSLPAHPDRKSAIDYAYRHWKIIQRFGRSPHRNQILGRTNTPEETEFLQQADSKF